MAYGYGTKLYYWNTLTKVSLYYSNKNFYMITKKKPKI